MIQFTNNATTLLASAIVAADTTLALSTGSGSEFPAISEGAIFMGTLKNPTTGAIEHVRCTARTGDAVTIVRAQEGTVALDFPVNSIFSLRLTRDTINSMFLGRRNRLINGKFDFWDYGPTFASPADGTYVANRWKVNRSGTAGTFSVSRQAVTLGSAGFDIEPPYWIRWDQTVAADAGAILDLRQRIEDVRNFAGKTITLSFWGRSNSGGTALQVLTEQYFGTGGSPSTTVSQTAQNVTLTTSAKKYQFQFTIPSIAGKTLGTNNNHSFDVVFRFPVSATFQHEFTLIQCEESPLATPFEYRSLTDTRADCDRYYWNTFPDGTAPASAAGTPGAMQFFVLVDYATSPVETDLSFHYPVQMRAVPTITTYNPAVGGAAPLNLTTSANANLRTGTPLRRWAPFSAFHGSDVVGQSLAMHVAVSAEL